MGRLRSRVDWRRRRRDGEVAFYACSGPTGTSLVGLVRVAGTRWAVEEGFEQAKGEVGLDHYQVRKWPGWWRWCGPPRPRRASCWPGPGGVDAIRPRQARTLPPPRKIVRLEY
jgi:hypothetical protein